MKKLLAPFARLKRLVSREAAIFFEFFFYYIRKKIINFSIVFENNKNRLVKVFLMKRGRYNRPFLHLTTIGILGLGVMIAPFISETYPVFAQTPPDLDLAASDSAKQSVLAGEEVFQTQVSDKPRDKVIEYTVEKGDTISTIARKFSTKNNPISEDTIRWENNLTGDNVEIGDTLRILPVTGMSHKVAAGDTVYTIAKKYNTEAQKIVDFTFNEFANPETFALVTGQILIVPDGIKPTEKPVTRQTFIARGPVPVARGGFTFPLRGGISQYFSFYHSGLDITSPIGTPIVAAHNGTVTQVSVGTWDTGYGTNVYVSNGAGIVSHYAHMSSVNVRVGQSVTGGRSVVGWVGMTGRTTGPHVHFEMTQGGRFINPLAYIQ